MYTLLAGSSIFIGAFLLFQLQPMLAKAILPWFGGSAAVWTTCLMFFQTVLFLGYWYAHWLTTRVSARKQIFVHGALLAVSLAVLPVLPSADWKPAGDDNPVSRILLLLAVTAGLPYFLLASTSPLTQAWFSKKQGGSLPYRYFALSNLASLVALLGYPLLVEPSSSLGTQAKMWSAGYAVYAIICISVGWLTRQASATEAEVAKPVAVRQAEAIAASDEIPEVLWPTKIGWMLLAALASVLSLSVTNHLTQNVAPIPLLWVLPLAVYLITFILCFERDGWYPRQWMLPLHGVGLAGLSYLLVKQRPDTDLRLMIAALLVGLFLACMFLHGELARRKPSAKYLTEFYLMISLGGALGALLVGLAAPTFLAGSYELPIAVAACALFTLMMEYRKAVITDILWTSVAVGCFVGAGLQVVAYRAPARVMMRSFYGGLRVVDQEGRRNLVHGVISHGTQFLDADRRRTATSYFAAGTGVERSFAALRAVHSNDPQFHGLRVGVIGLGAGTLAAYSEKGDTFRFYELNPQVAQLAREEFSFLKDSPAKVDVLLGDGRLQLEREEPQNFDLLVVDAFSGDSIPVHLLSREAMDVYFRHVNPNGLLAFHVSNTSLTLAPVVAKVAEDLHFAAVRMHAFPDPAVARSETEWVIIARRPEQIARPEFKVGAEPFNQVAGLRMWTDDYSTLFPILR